MRINFTIAYIHYSLSNLCSVKLTGYLLCRRVLFLWRQEDTSSLRLFTIDNSGRQMIRNFSMGQSYIFCLSCCTASVMRYKVFDVVVFKGTVSR